MSNYNFTSIKNTVLGWYDKLYNNDIVKIAKDNDEMLIIDFDFTMCLAQLTVSDSEYNPYQYVFFEVVDLETGKQIYCFYDDVNMLQNDVINSLDKALEFCVNYQDEKVNILSS